MTYIDMNDNGENRTSKHQTTKYSVGFRSSEAPGFSTWEAPPNPPPLSRLQGKLLKGCLETIVGYVIICKKDIWQYQK